MASQGCQGLVTAAVDAANDAPEEMASEAPPNEVGLDVSFAEEPES
jgi:hypothetical protein